MWSVNHLERLVVQVHLEQRVSHQVSEATAVEVTVRPRVTSAVVDLRELQATVLVEVVSMEILVLTEHLPTKGGSHVHCYRVVAVPTFFHWTSASVWDAHVKRKKM